MMDQEIMNRLRRLGFSSYEARVYVTLLKYGSLSSMDLVKAAKIPQPRLYDVMESLQAKGLVKVSRTKPLRVSLINPEIALRDYLEGEYKALTGLLDETLSLINTLTRRGVEELTEGAIWLVKGERGVLSEVKNLVLSTEDELLVFTYPDLFRRLASTQAVRSKLEGLSLCLIITDKTFEEMYKLVDELRYKPTFAPSLFISDLKRAVIVKPSPNRENMFAYVVEDIEILSIIVEYYLGMLESSETLYENPITWKQKTYRTLARVIGLFLKARERGVPLVVEIEGFWVRDRRYEVVKGVLVDYKIDKLRNITSIIVDTDKYGRISVGGKGAIYEDFEGIRIKVIA
ncbi:TrmB family transcriptional regulator [Infirmifilum sp.]|uniref:TrmB family transcriptional regulator n=1 Tax=Infirmifilum sp. TaxID=2856575 RepID=UPI003D0A0873